PSWPRWYQVAVHFDLSYERYARAELLPHRQISGHRRSATRVRYDRDLRRSGRGRFDDGSAQDSAIAAHQTQSDSCAAQKERLRGIDRSFDVRPHRGGAQESRAGVESGELRNQEKLRSVETCDDAAIRREHVVPPSL